MVQYSRILVSGLSRTPKRVGRAFTGLAGVVVVIALGGCGQQGSLYLPTDAAAANRATLPQTLLPKMTVEQPTDPAASAPSRAASR